MTTPLRTPRSLATLAVLCTAACSGGGGGDAPFRPGSGSNGTTLVGAAPSTTTQTVSFGSSLTPSGSKRLYALVADSVSGLETLNVYAPPFSSASVPVLTVPLVDTAGNALAPTTLAVDAAGDVALGAIVANAGPSVDVIAAPLRAASVAAPLPGVPVALADTTQVAVAFDSQARLLVLGSGATTSQGGAGQSTIAPQRVIRFAHPVGGGATAPDVTLDFGSGLAFVVQLQSFALGPNDELLLDASTMASNGDQFLVDPMPYSAVAPVDLPIGVPSTRTTTSIASDANGSVYAAAANVGIRYLQGPLANLPAPTGAGNGPGAVATPAPPTLTVPLTVGTGDTSIALDPSGTLYVIGSSVASLAGTQVSFFSRPLSAASAPIGTLPCSGSGCSFTAIAFGP